MSTKGKPRPTGKTISEAEFRRLWADLSLSVAQIGKMLGISQQAVSGRAKGRGLPARPARGGSKAMIPREAFYAAWQAGVTVEAMAAMLGCDGKTIRNTRRRMGLPKRALGRKCNPEMTLEDYRAMRLREAMAVSAKAEQAAMAEAGMMHGHREPGRTRRAA